ncbi:MtrAB system histidine kinase MtrB [Rhodococcus xishaensis]|uniref:Sensor histidine kinase MtrB n=1 Tax=Rhodococcus xishaensis TaxID=2487364 RepID=A0A3S3AI93_9NOCA|nr:MtrAB system histidine kinase MtrB [Rhodococcus xishaensis]RVW05257.1 sensor histidine kinase [Rhodococcus xishaensis]
MIGAGRNRRRVNRAFASLIGWCRAWGNWLTHLWRRSLQLRVVVSTLSLSLIVITILGVVLTSQITDRLLEAKVTAATEEMDRARSTIEAQLSGADDSGSLQLRLDAARLALTNREPEGGQTSGSAGTFDPVLIVPGDGPREPTYSGPLDEVPTSLRDFVQANQISYQFATVSDPDGYSGPALVIGSPTSSDISTLELYLVFPLASEDRSLSLVRGTMLIGGAVLAVLLAAISMLVARQVVLPIRSASRIAVRFADGRLKERMPVRGEDDMARLAMSFNEMAESLSKQIMQLEEFGNLQKRFTSDVSHELRTPLTTVRMAADLIHDSSDDLDPLLKRSSELLVTELDRFESLLGDLLEISRHDAGVAELAAEQLDVRMCAEASISTVRHLARETATELIVDFPDDPVIAEVDPRRVERILRNLLANAIDHGEGKPVLLRLRADDDAVAFTVRDQGIGLRPGEEKLVFNRFWRSDPSRVRRSGGTGLGLAISVEDANLHNGTLEAWGEPGRGACFRLTLPRVRGRKVTRSPLPLKPGTAKLPQGLQLPGTRAVAANGGAEALPEEVRLEQAALGGASTSAGEESPAAGVQAELPEVSTVAMQPDPDPDESPTIPRVRERKS